MRALRALLPLAGVLPLFPGCSPAEEVLPEVEAAESEPEIDMEGMEEWAYLLGHNTPYELPTDWKGQANGQKTLWHDNGTKQGEGEFLDSMKVGPWIFWHPNGERRWEGTYAADVPTGVERAWYDDGYPHYEGSYEGGLRQGAFSFWYPGGRLWWKGAFEQGKREGLFVMWTSTGEIDPEESGIYRSDVKVEDVDLDRLEALRQDAGMGQGSSGDRARSDRDDQTPPG